MQKLRNEELGRKTVEEFKSAEKLPLIIVLDNVRSAINVGSVFRSADAFLIEAIYLCGITAQPPHKDILKSALGSTDSVAWKYFEKTIDAVNNLKEKGYKIFAIEQAEDSIKLDEISIDKNEKLAIAFGHEVNGVSQEVMDVVDGCIELTQLGTKHSLNISVCAGIVMYDLFLKLR